MNLKIIRATVDDVEDISYVHARSWQAAYSGIVPQDFLDEFTPEKRAELGRKVMPARPEEYYISYLDETPMGMFIIGSSLQEDTLPHSGEVFALYLLPEYWGKGYGRLLMDYAVMHLYELSYHDIFLWVLEDNIRARTFYEKYGFVFDGIKKEIVIGKPLIEIRYVLKHTK
jgi:GNAT superfamily N-acetyltransferase